MKRKTWRKNHKWIGIIITFFLVMFCLSGIVLNCLVSMNSTNGTTDYYVEHYATKIIKT